MVTTSAPHPTELLPSYALDALEDGERRDVETHLATCPTCRAEIARLTAATDALAETVAPVTPPPAARQRLMARVAADRTRTSAERQVGETTPLTRTERTGRGAGRAGLGTWIAGSVSAAAIAVAAFTSWQAADARRELLAARTELRAHLDALAEVSAAGGVTRVSVVQGTNASPGTSGQLVYQPAGRTAVAVVDRLPPLQPGRVYQLWLLRGGTPTPAGTLTVDADGRGHAILRATDRLESYTGLGLTAEPAPNLPAPTGAILATAALTNT
jgi:anti-sigma factor RsiW